MYGSISHSLLTKNHQHENYLGSLLKFSVLDFTPIYSTMHMLLSCVTYILTIASDPSSANYTEVWIPET